MTFIERCHQHHDVSNRWMKNHPWLCMMIAPAIAGIMILLWMFVPVGLLILFPALYGYVILMMIGDGIWKSRTGYYEKNRCKECGRFIEPNQ